MVATSSTTGPRPYAANSSPATGKPGARDGNTLALTDKEILDLIKTTSTEVDASLPEAQRVLMSRAVADTILNRKACDCFGASTITDIVNQPWQFSAISSNLPYAYGTVDKMPISAIKPLVRKDVEAWLADRANGTPAQEYGLNFLNPYHSGASALSSWGWEVVRQAEANGHVYGDIRRRSVHYHGTAPGHRGKESKPYTIVLPQGWKPH
ncbi:cell wall hydrolase [Mesorhizobium sp. M1A.F.Ca.IN.022.07.1.1]|uniref:cell wall hydrolase n=1 Tax=Mesorhizobium sp. M1A.F.Ca.IN.022.07.1.1 TaxID=2496767 RepID=UPI0013E01034|nr:cell wall hydrolase [Mesorhizobium sp. M1A.F.Ca.IN.022.07.1.1]